MTTDSTPGIPAAGDTPWARDSIEDGDGYAFALPLVEGELHRAGSDSGSIDMVVRDHGQLFLTQVQVGFPVVGRVAPTANAIALAVVLDAPPGNRWDGRDLAAGDVILYPAGAANNCIERPGLRYGAIILDQELLAEAIDELGRRPAALEHGPLRGDLARDVMRTFGDAMVESDPESVVAVVVSVLSTSSTTRSATRRILSSETITQRAIDYVHSTGDWAPSSLALCRATRVSERRVQLAFTEMYGMTPTGFFRLRALSMARKRLQNTGETRAPVTTIATELGFYHLSRFAEDYRDAFGENPSETLANSGLRRSA